MWPADRPKHVQNHNSYSLEDSLKQFEDICGNCKNTKTLEFGSVSVKVCCKDEQAISVGIYFGSIINGGYQTFNVPKYSHKMCETGLEMKK